MSIRYDIKGQSALRGTITVKGSPLAAVGVLAAAIVSQDKVTITNVPHLRDIDTLMNELRQFGVAIDWTHNHEVTAHASQVDQAQQTISYSDIAGWPPSLLAAVIIRTKQLTITDISDETQELDELCTIMQQFGAAVSQTTTISIILDHLHAASIDLGLASADHTLTALVLASTADGQTLIDGAVINPEVEDVIQCLRQMGASIERIDEARLQIIGQSDLHGTTHAIVPDRYEAAFLATAAYITSGDLQVGGVKSALIMPFLAKVQQMSGNYTVDSRSIRFWRDSHHQPWQSLQLNAKPFPGLSEDWLYLFMALACLADGTSQFSSDQQHELQQAADCLTAFEVAANFDSYGLHINGPAQLQSSQYEINSFAAGIIGLLLALASPGHSQLKRMTAIDGRFESLVDRLVNLGAHITRTEDEDSQ